ncbi:MAG: hypothetical protein PHO48_02195 [Candidatus Gracilibacteria bacterium]|nr:hypothetical protein [Candidatus Gracilibacteria bacterium]
MNAKIRCSKSNIMLKKKNTYRQGLLTFLSYKTSEGNSIAACEELCLLVEEKDSELARLKILANAKSYLCNVIENKLGEHLLNQSLPKEIKDEFAQFVKITKNLNSFQRYQEKIEDIIKEDNCYVAGNE